MLILQFRPWQPGVLNYHVGPSVMDYINCRFRRTLRLLSSPTSLSNPNITYSRQFIVNLVAA